MKRLWLIMLLIPLLSSVRVHGTPTRPYQGPRATPFCWIGKQGEAEFRVAYFYPTSKRFREICPGARIDYGLEGTFYLRPCLGVFGNLTWLPTNGRSLWERHHTHVDLVPFTAGLRYRFCWNRCMALRVGLGVAYFFVSTRDRSDCRCIQKHTFHQNAGVVAKADWQWKFCQCVYVDLFADYLYLPINTVSGCSQVGGFNFGIGIGRRF